MRLASTRPKANGAAALLNSAKVPLSVEDAFTGSITGITDLPTKPAFANSLRARSSYCLPLKYGKYICLTSCNCFGATVPMPVDFLIILKNKPQLLTLFLYL